MMTLYPRGLFGLNARASKKTLHARSQEVELVNIEPPNVFKLCIILVDLTTVVYVMYRETSNSAVLTGMKSVFTWEYFQETQLFNSLNKDYNSYSKTRKYLHCIVDVDA